MQLTAKLVDESFAAVQAAFRQVRPLILTGAGAAKHTQKDDGSPVTDVDIEAERIILSELKRQFPTMAVYGEESGYEDNLTDDFWLIDPIDGTKSLLKNIPAYTSMAVLIQNGEATRSVIYNTHDDDMYIAQKDNGAFKNGERLDLRNVPLPRIAFCRDRLVSAADEILKPMHVACEAGPTGAGYGFSRVADGRLAARLNFPYKPGGGHPHDYAPGALLVREAGGAIISVESDTYTYKTRSFVACHPELESIMREHAKQLRSLEIQTA